MRKCQECFTAALVLCPFFRIRFCDFLHFLLRHFRDFFAIVLEYIRFADQSIKDGLYHKYKKTGKVVSVKVCGDKDERYGVVQFRRFVFFVFFLLFSC